MSKISRGTVFGPLLCALFISAQPPVVAGASVDSVATCGGITATAIHFGNIIPSTERATMDAFVTVTCSPHVSYRLRLDSRNDCTLSGPKSEQIKYAVFSDRAYHHPVLDCEAFPVELEGTGTTTFHLFARTAKLLAFAAGKYTDVIYMEVVKDKEDR